MKYLKTYEERKNKSLIEELDLSYENLPELPDLSEYINLKILYCSYSKLMYLSELPKKLRSLYCHNNKLTSLPKLPKKLKLLSLSDNNLTSLPELPNTLNGLYCGNNQLTSLPELPDILKDLYCEKNNLTSLPQLPDTLELLECKNNELPFEDLVGYKKWYQENKHIIDKEGLEYAYQLHQNINKYNL